MSTICGRKSTELNSRFSRANSSRRSMIMQNIFGPIDSGFFLLYNIGGATAADNNIQLRNNYSVLFSR